MRFTVLNAVDLICTSKTLENLKCINPHKSGVLFMELGKQNSRRCDAAKHGNPSGAFLFA